MSKKQAPTLEPIPEEADDTENIEVLDETIVSSPPPAHVEAEVTVITGGNPANPPEPADATPRRGSADSPPNNTPSGAQQRRDDNDSARAAQNAARSRSKTPSPSTNTRTPPSRRPPRRPTQEEQREELQRERLEAEKRRARQMSDRAKRHKEREDLKKARAAAEQRRKQEALRIQEQAMNWRRLAASRTDFETRRNGGLPPSSTDSSSSGESDIDTYEDLPGEIEFLAHFKQVRDRSPTREELIEQRCGDARDSIAEVLKEIDQIERCLDRGVQPRQGNVEELFERYENLTNRTTHLCYTQGSYAKMRGLKRGETLLTLDIEIKRKLERLLQEYKRLKIADRLKRKQSKTKRKEARGRAASDPSSQPTQPPGNHPTRVTHSLTEIDQGELISGPDYTTQTHK